MPAGMTGDQWGEMGGTILEGVGSIFGGLTEQQDYFNQGTRYRQQAALDLYSGGLEVQKQEKAATKNISETQAASGAAGVTSGGSTAVAERESITNANMADAACRFSAKMRNLNDLYEANVQDWKGKQQAMSGILSGGLSLGAAAAAPFTGGASLALSGAALGG